MWSLARIKTTMDYGSPGKTNYSIKISQFIYVLLVAFIWDQAAHSSCV
jgi:hypothetical protein